MPFPQQVVDELLTRSKRCCCLCRQYKGRNIEIHHIIPKAQGGRDEFDNGIPLCFDCHAEVHAYDPEHPKGRKYQPVELRQSRDELFAMFSDGRVIVLNGRATPVPLVSGSNDPEMLRWQNCADYLRIAMTDYICQMQTRLDEADACPDEPYKGLFHFDLSDTAIFFGRQEAIRQLMARIRGRGKSHRLAVLYGLSGVGKTSLICAGLVPALLRSGNVPLCVRAYAVPDVAVRRPILNAAPLDELPPEELDDLSLHEFLRLACSGLAGQKLVIFLDQFEDLFISHVPETRVQFIAQLASCYHDEALPIHFVLSLRKDFLADLDEFRASIPYVLDNRYRLDPLTRIQAAHAITKPVEPLGITYDPALVNRVLDDLLEEGGVQPSQLQLVCQALLSHAQIEERTAIIEADYRARGGTRGILSNYIHEQIHHFSSKEQGLARNVLEELITSEKTSKPQTLSELATSLEVARAKLRIIVDKLMQIRLLRVTEQEERVEETYELAHPCLADILELSEETKFRKAAQELIAQGVEDWKKHHLTMSLDRLKRLDGQRDNVRLDAEAKELLLRSVLRADYGVEYWLSRFPDRRRASQIASDVGQPCPALWSLRADLPLPLRIRVGLSVMKKRVLVLFSIMALIALIPLITGVGVLEWRQEVQRRKLSNASILAGMLPEDRQHIRTYRLDTNRDEAEEWILLYRLDLFGEGEELRSPIGAVVYQLDDSIPPNIISHELHPRDGDYLCECACIPTMANVLSGLDGDELVFRDQCSDQTSRLTIFHWDADEATYVAQGHFYGTGIEVALDEVTVREPMQDRAQLSKCTTYHAFNNRTYYQPSGDSTLISPEQEEIVFSKGEPEDVLCSPYPEKVVLAFYQHYNEDERAPAYFAEKVRDHLGQCDAGECGCIAPRHEIDRVRVTYLQPETYNEAPCPDIAQATVGARIICERRGGVEEGERYIRWHLSQENCYWKLARVE